jgi:hypothetical protein
MWFNETFGTQAEGTILRWPPGPCDVLQLALDLSHLCETGNLLLSVAIFQTTLFPI